MKFNSVSNGSISITLQAGPHYLLHASANTLLKQASSSYVPRLPAYLQERDAGLPLLQKVTYIHPQVLRFKK